MLQSPATADSLADEIRLACLLEATARKPGNVHPGHSFSDLQYAQFATAAAVSAPWLARAGDLGVGEAIFRAAQATHTATGTNVNLGTLLLIAPLASIPAEKSLREELPRLLAGLNVADAGFVVQAIQLMKPGGLGRVSAQDVTSLPSVPLTELMALAQERDRVALQYARGFSDLFDVALPLLQDSLSQFPADWNRSIIHLQLQLLARWPDSHIARRCGIDVANEVSRRAADLLDCGWPSTEVGRAGYRRFEAWMQDGTHRRNPGTTADLIAATLFVALRARRLSSAERTAALQFVSEAQSGELGKL